MFFLLPISSLCVLSLKKCFPFTYTSIDGSQNIPYKNTTASLKVRTNGADSGGALMDRMYQKDQ